MTALRHLPAAGRVETGPIQFGDDWPGYFLRGDDALNYRKALNVILEAARRGSRETVMAVAVVGELRDRLEKVEALLLPPGSSRAAYYRDAAEGLRGALIHGEVRRRAVIAEQRAANAERRQPKAEPPPPA